MHLPDKTSLRLMFANYFHYFLVVAEDGRVLGRKKKKKKCIQRNLLKMATKNFQPLPSSISLGIMPPGSFLLEIADNSLTKTNELNYIIY